MSTAGATPASERNSSDEIDDQEFSPGDEKKINLPETLRDLAIVSLVAVPIQMIATDLSVVDVLLGIAVLYGICVVGILLTKYVPFYLPSVAWISLVAIALTLPMLPWSQAVLPLVVGIDFLALAVPPLAYAGFAITAREMNLMKTSGWKIFVIAILVFIGTYVGSALIAELILGLTGS